MLIDLSSKFTYAFTPATHTFLTLPHKFYIKQESKTSAYIQTNKLFSTISDGFSLQSQMLKDLVCLSDVCREQQILSVITMQENYWNYNQNLTHVGGILGLASCSDALFGQYMHRNYFIALG